MSGIGYSYQRCSNIRQVKGSTKERQAELLRIDALDYCRRNNLTLDETHTFNDWGIPSFRGENVKKGALGQFFLAIDKGKIEKGDYLFVEAIDRLTRLPLDEADQLLRRILRAGVSIVALKPFYELKPSDLNDMGKRMTMIAMCDVAHRSSADKSKWLTAAWKKKREHAAEKKLTKVCPVWLRLSEDRKRFEQIPEVVKVIKRICRMYLDGHGSHTIMRTLQAEGVPPFTQGRKRGANVWYESTVAKLLTNPALIGDYHVRSGGNRNSHLTGEVLEGYYGKGIISRADYERIQRRRRRHADRRSPQKFVTLFPRLIHDARDKSVMNPVSKGGRYDSDYRLVSSLARVGKGKFMSAGYHAIERAFIHWTQELTLADIQPSQPDSTLDEIEAAQLQLDSLDDKMSRLSAQLDKEGANIEALASKMVKWDAEKRALTSSLAALRTHVKQDKAALLHNTQELAKELYNLKGEKEREARLKLRMRIGELVESIWMLVYDVEHNGKRKRIADVQVFFRDGDARQLCIWPDGYCVICPVVIDKPFENVGENWKIPAKILKQDLRQYDEKKYEPFWDWIAPGEDPEFQKFMEEHAVSLDEYRRYV